MIDFHNKHHDREQRDRAYRGERQLSAVERYHGIFVMLILP